MRTSCPIFIFDGGLGTSLEDKYRVQFSSTKTPLWSSHLLVADQATLLDCQSDFVHAGADIIGTATYQVSIDGFANTRTADWPNGISLPNIGTFLEDAVLIASQSGRPVALSLGPYGATMAPSQEYGAKYDAEHEGITALVAWHLQRWMLFAKVDGLLNMVDYIAFETIPRLDEIIAIRKMAADADAQALSWPNRKPLWISCVYPGDDDALPDGTSAERAVEAMLSRDVDGPVPWGIGINCTRVGKLHSLVQKYEEVVKQMLGVGEIRDWPSLVLYPDGTNGELYNTTTQQWEIPEGKEAPTESWESKVAEVVKVTQSRARWRSIVVGGCCKTSHKDIERLRSSLCVHLSDLDDLDD